MAESKRTIVPADFFVLRSPLLAFDRLQDWTGDGTRGRDQLRAHLAAMIAQPDIAEALFVASPGLEESIERWRRDPDSKRGRKLEQTLCRYVARMAGRATPFGLFAGCSVGEVGDTTSLSTAGRDRFERSTRLDMEYLFALAEALGNDPRLRRVLRYFPNSSLYEAPGCLRYAESRFDGARRTHQLVALDPTDYLIDTIDRAQEGARLPDLAAALVDDEITIEEAEEYIGELIDSQVLVSELDAPVTGDEPIHSLIAVLEQYAETADLAKTLKAIRGELASIDADGLGVAAQRYRSIAESLEALPADVKLPRLFQVDMMKPADGLMLGRTVIDEIKRAVELQRRIAPQNAYDPLDDFRRDFSERYGDREVPLVEALDEESGIGFMRRDEPGSGLEPLLDGIVFPPVAGPDGVTWNAQHSFLLKQLWEAWSTGSQEIDLDPKDIDGFAGTAAELPDAFSVLATVAAASEEDIDQGRFRILMKGISGPSGARVLGRFCHCDPELSARVRQHLRDEEALAPDTTFAEIVHLPEGRIGNILSRPVLRDYEIPYLGRSGTDIDHQLSINDLKVRVEHGRVILRSERLGRDIEPRLTSAHNYATPSSLGLYTFLGSLQHQGVAAGLIWNWGPLAAAPFLPRIASGRIVLSRAQWLVMRSDLSPATNGEHEVPSSGDAQTGAQTFDRVQAWRTRARVPRFIAIADGDNELAIDLDNSISVDTFATLVEKRGRATILEYFPAPDELCATSPEGNFAHEIIVPMTCSGRRTHEAGSETHRPKHAPGSDPQETQPVPVIQSRLTPGSEWLHINLYAGTTTMDELLRELVAPVSQHALQSAAADRWFFIRYNEGGWHLRLRFHGEPRRLSGELLPMLADAAEPFIESGQVWRMQLGTYDREIERYAGSAGMLVSEKLFHVDSEAALQIVEHCVDDEGHDARWRLALVGIDRLLDDFNFDLDTKRAITTRWRDGLLHEFGFGAHGRRQLGQKFRDLRPEVAALLARRGTERASDPGAGSGEDDGDPREEALDAGFAILAARSQALAPLVTELRELDRSGKLTMTLDALVASYLHMHVNRVQRSSQRAQELLMYDLLTKHYESLAARRKKQ